MFANFWGRRPELVPEPLLGNAIQRPLKRGFRNHSGLLPGKFANLVWFAGTTPENFMLTFSFLSARNWQALFCCLSFVTGRFPRLPLQAQIQTFFHNKVQGSAGMAALTFCLDCPNLSGYCEVSGINHRVGTSAGLVQVSKQPKCPKVLRESAKGVFGPPGREPQNSLLHGAKPCFRLLPPVRNRGLHGARDSFWTLGPERPKALLALSFSTFGHFGCFDTCTRPSGLQPSRPKILTKSSLQK